MMNRFIELTKASDNQKTFINVLKICSVTCTDKKCVVMVDGENEPFEVVESYGKVKGFIRYALNQR